MARRSSLELFMSDTQTGRRDTLEEPRPLSNLCMRVIWHLPNIKYYGENSNRAVARAVDRLTSGKLRWAVGLKHNGSVRIHALLQGGIMCATWIQLLDGTDRAVIATIIFTSHPGASMPTGSGTIVSTLSSTSSNASALCTACSS